MTQMKQKAFNEFVATIFMIQYSYSTVSTMLSTANQTALTGMQVASIVGAGIVLSVAVIATFYDIIEAVRSNEKDSILF